MAATTYKAFVLLRGDSDLTLDALEARLRERFAPFPKRTVEREDADELCVNSPAGWTSLWLREGVGEENAALAAQLAPHPLAAEMAACPRRLQIWTSRKDPDGSLRALFEGVCATAGTFAGVVVVDLLSRRVLEKGELEGRVVDAPGPADGEGAEVPSAEELYRQARGRWQQVVDLGLHDDRGAILGTTGLLQEAVRQDPGHVKALALLSDLLAALTAYEEAAALVRKLRELEPGAEGHRRRAELLALPNGEEKQAEIRIHLAVKWQTTADW